MVIFGAAVFCTAAAAGADKVAPPLIRPGLWEREVDNLGPVARHCVGENFTLKEWAEMTLARLFACGDLDLNQDGERLRGEQSCAIKSQRLTHRLTLQTVFTGSYTDKFQVQATAVYEPPLLGHERVDTTQTARRLGPCARGQQAGDLILRW